MESANNLAVQLNKGEELWLCISVLFSSPSRASSIVIDWAADSKSLWVPTSTNTGTYALLNIDLQGRVRSTWQQNKLVVGWAIPSPDGRRLALQLASGDSNVWMVENF